MIGPAQVLVLLEDWIEDLGHLTTEQFLAAVREYRQHKKFFPCTADILDAHDALKQVERPKRNLVALPSRPQGFTEEQLELNKRRCRGIIDSLGGKRSPAA